MKPNWILVANATVARILQDGARQGSYGALAIHASSPFLGELKQALGEAARRLLTGTQDVDLTSFGVQEIEQRLQQATAR